VAAPDDDNRAAAHSSASRFQRLRAACG
jgi:hypothetical protein